MMIRRPVSWLRWCALTSMLFALGCAEKPSAPQMAASEPAAAAASPEAASPPAAAGEEPVDADEEFTPPEPAGPEYLDLLTPDRPRETAARSGEELNLLFDLVGIPETPENAGPLASVIN